VGSTLRQMHKSDKSRNHLIFKPQIRIFLREEFFSSFVPSQNFRRIRNS